MWKRLLLLCVAVCVLGAAKKEPADLVLTGVVWTADPENSRAEAVATKGGTIVYVGSSREAEAYRGANTQWIDLPDRLILPGFNDSHIHLMGGALGLDRVDLMEDNTLEAMQAHIRDFARKNPDRQWVLGRGWFYSSFPGGMPTKEQLDAAVPDRPAYMDCYDGHTGWANSKALEAAGITKDTKDPEDGEIVRDPKTGEPTGALKESAMALVDSKVPLPDDETRYKLVVRAFRLLNSQGITSIQDADYSLEDLDRNLKLFERAAKSGDQTVRMITAVRFDQETYKQVIPRARQLADTHNADPLRFGTVKSYVDGVIEARTAAMLAPYADSAERGSLTWDPEKLNEAVVLADRSHLQVYLHAIGDLGVRSALNAYEAALRTNGASDRRGRIEHIETISPQDYPRFPSLGVIASMQPLHADPNQNIFDVWAKNAGPERSTRAFSWRNMEKSGARLIFGSDWPVVTSDVLRGVYCAVARKTKEGKPEGGWHPELAVSLESALRHYTIDAAYGSFDEKRKGSITVGKVADLTVLSRNLLLLPPESILKTDVLLTVYDGRVVYRGGSAPSAKAAR